MRNYMSGVVYLSREEFDNPVCRECVDEETRWKFINVARERFPDRLFLVIGDGLLDNPIYEKVFETLYFRFRADVVPIPGQYPYAGLLIRSVGDNRER